MLPVNCERQSVGESQFQTSHLACGLSGQALNPSATPFRRDIEIHPEQSRHLPIQKPSHSRYDCKAAYDLVIAVKDDQTMLVAPIMPEAVVAQEIATLF
jgi:hypothetical protein